MSPAEPAGPATICLFLLGVSDSAMLRVRLGDLAQSVSLIEAETLLTSTRKPVACTVEQVAGAAMLTWYEANTDARLQAAFEGFQSLGFGDGGVIEVLRAREGDGSLILEAHAKELHTSLSNFATWWREYLIDRPLSFVPDMRTEPGSAPRLIVGTSIRRT